MKILNFYSIDNIIINNLLENRKKFQEFEEFGNKVSRILDRFLKKKNPLRISKKNIRIGRIRVQKLFNIFAIKGNKKKRA